MLQKFMISKLRWLAVVMSLWTMIFSPLALGQESQKISEEKLRSAVVGLGLNKQMTIGQFYERNKYLVPDRVKKQMEGFIALNKNQMMPIFEVVSNKGTAGSGVPTLRVTQGKELINLQWYGEKNKFLKFQNTNLSEVDVINFDDMFTRIVAGDEKYKKQIDAKPKNLMTKEFKYPTITKQQWKTMPNIDKAQYIVNLRQTWTAAREVLALKEQKKEKQKKKKTSSFDFLENNQHFYKLFFGEEAYANQQSRYFDADACVVAGYKSEYRSENGREVCSVTAARERYASRPLYAAAAAKCSQSSPTAIACNPYVYGAPNGNPICLEPSRTNAEFQRATHFDGPCERGVNGQGGSRLQTEEFGEKQFLRENKSQGRYSDDNLSMTLPELEEAYKAHHSSNKSLSENYILGVLKLRGIAAATGKDRFEQVVLDDTTRPIIEEIRSEFVSHIEEARRECQNVSASGKRVEPNYWKACDQLHRRFLFIELAVQNNCATQGMVPDSNGTGCACPTNTGTPVSASGDGTLVEIPTPTPTPVPVPVPTPVIVPVPTPTPVPVPVPTPTPAPASTPIIPPPPAVVAPGASCPVATPVIRPTTPPEPRPQQASNRCDEAFSNAPDCTCASGRAPRLEVEDSNNGAQVFTCAIATADGGNGRDRKECGFFCGLWKGVKVVAPFAIAGIAGYFLYKWMSPEKPTLAAPPDKCPNGSIPPCAQTCTPPLSLQSTGACGCPACPPPQVSNAATCQCTAPTGGGTNPTLITCPDGATRAANLEACPDYPCWNGQSYKNPMNCPPAPAPTAAPSGITQ